jgi:hypothetical protein
MSFISKKLRQSAGHTEAHCMLNIAGVCPDETPSKTAGNMLCHIRMAGMCGGGQKPDDTMATFGCGPCHTVFDGNGVRCLSEQDWLYYALRGMARTTRFWLEHGFLTEGKGK